MFLDQTLKKKGLTFFFEQMFGATPQKGLKFSKKSSKMTVLFSQQKNTSKRLLCPEDKKYPKTTFNFGRDFSKKKKHNIIGPLRNDIKW